MNPPEQHSLRIAREILALFNQHRRANSCHHSEYHDCLAVHVNKLTQLISRNEVLHLVLPAFPAKSPNTNKTWGILPDLGEQLALCFLNQLCSSIKAIYPRGAEIIICSDGRVFNDLVGVRDQDVDAYSEKIKNIIAEHDLSHISLFALDDSYGAVPYQEMRKNLIIEYSEDDESIRNTIKNCALSRQQFNGIHRFIFEDTISIMTSLSRNKIKTLSKKIALQVVKRSNAWSNLVEHQFPDALRLSIHPQICGSAKIGLMLLKATDNWATPWHRVVLYDGNEHVLVKKKDAEQLGATAVFENDHFSHYILKENHYAC